MALSFQTQEAAIRSQIHTDVIAAWGAAKVYDDVTEIPDKSLPIASVLLAETNPNSEEGGMREEGIDLVYQITGKFRKPSAGSLAAARMTAAEELRARLCGARRYVGHNWDWLGDAYLPGDAEGMEREAQQEYFTVMVRFSVTITVPAY